jgi:hypothetical protein
VFCLSGASGECFHPEGTSSRCSGCSGRPDGRRDASRPVNSRSRDPIPDSLKTEGRSPPGGRPRCVCMRQVGSAHRPLPACRVRWEVEIGGPLQVPRRSRPPPVVPLGPLRTPLFLRRSVTEPRSHFIPGRLPRPHVRAPQPVLRRRRGVQHYCRRVGRRRGAALRPARSCRDPDASRSAWLIPHDPSGTPCFETGGTLHYTSQGSRRTVGSNSAGSPAGQGAVQKPFLGR